MRLRLRMVCSDYSYATASEQLRITLRMIRKDHPRVASLPGGNSEREPPDPISNSEVKTLCADGSVPFGHARVGHCQALKSVDSPAGRNRRGFSTLDDDELTSNNSSATCQRGCVMNTLQRREIVKSHIIDVAIAKTGIGQSRRERKEAAKKLRKAMAASRFAAQRGETISYPRQALG
jgi:hypothetical protein